jgi:cytochrome bd-type quinol oxidase subunit 2
MFTKTLRFFGSLALACVLGVAFSLAFRPVAYAADAAFVLQPIFDLVGPYFAAFISIAVTAVLGWLAALLKAKFGLDIDAAQRASLHEAAMTGVTKAVAAVEGTLGTKAYNVGSPIVTTAIAWMEKSVPDAIAHFGLGPDALASLVLSKIGLLQQASPSVPAATIAPPVAK